MTICQTHGERGMFVPATRIVVGLPMCDSCFAGLPVRPEVEMVGCDYYDHSGLKGSRLANNRDARGRHDL